MDAVRAFRDNRRENKGLKARLSDLNDEAKALDAAIQAHIEAGNLPTSMPVDGGGNVHIKHEVWASVPDDKLDQFHALMNGKYADTDWDLRYMVGAKPNTQSLRGWINERLDDDKLKTGEERLRGVIPDDLLDCLKVTDKHYVNANGL
jgi:hypothetical protein